MDIDDIFAIADGLHWGCEEMLPTPTISTCCGQAYITCYKDGHEVCGECGICRYGAVFNYLSSRTVPHCSNYKRLHHFHERISQLLLQESVIPLEHFESIKEKLQHYPTLCKSNIRAVLRSLKMQKYIEKWLQIIHRVAQVKPPSFPTQIMLQLDAMFVALEEPFERYKPATRKNFLNYNYTFHRFFQMMGVPQYSMFFPMIKSKQKLLQLDRIWADICVDLQWVYTPLIVVREFSVVNPLHAECTSPQAPEWRL
jgi:hypothetical protein